MIMFPYKRVLDVPYSGIHWEDWEENRYVRLRHLEEEEERHSQQTWRQPGGAKDTEAPTLALRSLPSKRMGQINTTRKEWVKGIPLKIWLNGTLL